MGPLLNELYHFRIMVFYRLVMQGNAESINANDIIEHGREFQFHDANCHNVISDSK